MYRKLVCAAAAGLALSLAATAVNAATTFVLNFDDLVGVGLMPTEYGGVIFGDDFSHYDTPVEGFPPASGQTTVYSNYAKHPPGIASTQTFRFAEDVRFDGAFFSGKAPVSYQFFRDGQAVGSALGFGLANAPRFFASGYQGLVDEVRLTGSPGNWVMDDLTFTTGVTAAVPEPGAWALMILGFGAAGAALRAKRRRAFA